MSNKTIVDMLSQAIFRLGKGNAMGALERVRTAEEWLKQMITEKGGDPNAVPVQDENSGNR